jgi:hypothetical protein
MINFINELSWGIIILACLTLGLAPFKPEPHIVEKIRMLLSGTLSRPIDWFDLVMHGIPWVLLILKAAITLKGK